MSEALSATNEKRATFRGQPYRRSSSATAAVTSVLRFFPDGQFFLPAARPHPGQRALARQ
jgi:hypothetical protein